MNKQLSRSAEFTGNEPQMVSGLKTNLGTGLQNPGNSITRSLRGDDQLRSQWIEPYQVYDFYTHSDHEAWRRLLERMASRCDRYATEHFKRGLTVLDLDPKAIPHLEDIDRSLEALTNFRTIPV